LIRDRLRRRSRRNTESGELNITAFLNLMVILVPFLLITAVFSRMAILELNLPSASEQTEEPEEKLRLEIIVRDDGLIVADGKQRIADVAKKDDEYDYDQLSEIMQEIKASNPDVLEASVLLEADTKYGILVHVMDAVRMVKVPNPEKPGETMQAELFPEIALGDAPQSGSGS